MRLSRVVVCVLTLLTMGITNGEAHNHGSVYTPSNNWNTYQYHSVSPPSKPVHAYTRKRHFVSYKHGHRFTHVAPLPRSSSDIVTVPTEAGISITVNKKIAPQFQGFIADLVKTGYTPPVIHCWAPVGTHVPNSNHYHGGACDFHQRGWGLTDAPMYHVTSLAAKWGLRDGCTFRHQDCGHIDDGTNVGWKHPNLPLQRYIVYQTTPVQRPVSSIRPNTVLENFEE